MSSKKDLKKAIKQMVFEVVEECFTIQLFDETKKEASEKLINDAIVYLNTAVSEINAAKDKATFKAIENRAEQKADEWVEALNKL
ncbi:MAG: hypothetical protein JJT77_12175 [Crocinitomicaceae bacterium]|nr:hypothetical protein [Crocinitomicaceae bacterium]